MKKIILTIIVLASIKGFAEIQERREKILGIISQEISELKKIVKNARGANPVALLRMAELNLEAARILTDTENERYLKIPISQRQKIDKKKFFKGSRRYFLNAQEIGHFMLKRHSHWPKIGEIYYILGKNALEFQELGKAHVYFEKAFQKSTGNQFLQDKVSLSLAEGHYNKKEYAKAIRYYEKGLGQPKTKWWTKDAFSLAWCYFREKRYDQAMDLMFQVHNLSKTKEFINMSYLVERDLAYFGVKSQQVNKVISFYKENGLNIPDKFMAVALYLEKEGKTIQSAMLLKEALKYDPTEKQLAEIYTNLLELFEKYGKYAEHLKVSKKIQKLLNTGKISSGQKEVLLYQSEKMAAVLQKQVVAKTYIKRPKIRKRKANLAVEYFKILKLVGPKDQGNWSFYIAETYFAIDSFAKAIPYYYETLKDAQEKNDQKSAERAVNGMMASLEKVSKNFKGPYLMAGYNFYLKNYPKSQKAFSIYQRVFSYHFNKGNLAEAEKALIGLKNNFKQGRDKQEKMLAKIVDYYRKKKNYDEVERWSRRITQGEFSVSKKFVKGVRLIYVSLKMEKIENAATSGDQTKVLEGYQEIYQNPVADKNSKSVAAYNMATIYHEQGDVKKTFLWANRALKNMKKSQVIKFRNSFFAMAKESLKRRYIKESMLLSKRSFLRLCGSKKKILKILFNTSNTLMMALKTPKAAINFVEKYQKCLSDSASLSKARYEILSYLKETKGWRTLNTYLNKLLKKKLKNSYLIEFYGSLRNHYLEQGQKTSAHAIKKKMLTLFDIKRPNTKQTLKYIARFEFLKLRKTFKEMRRITLSFPEKTFRRRLQKKYQSINNLKKILGKITSFRDLESIHGAKLYLIETYEKFAGNSRGSRHQEKVKSLSHYSRKTWPPWPFPLMKERDKLFKSIEREIVKKRPLSRFNFSFYQKKIGGNTLRYEGSHGPFLMDRGGRP